MLPHLRQLPAGDLALLPGKLADLFDVRRQQWLLIHYIEAIHQNEKVLARQMVESLARGALILCDLGYFGFT